jgi:small subunit ribosomal protein S11
MGKKHVIKKNEEELTKEGAKMEENLSKEPQITTSKRTEEGRVYITSSYNNTIISLTDKNGNVLGWLSAGSIGFKGSKKATPFAASKVAENIAQIAKKVGIEKISVFVKGIGSGRESAIRSLAARGLTLSH